MEILRAHTPLPRIGVRDPMPRILVGLYVTPEATKHPPAATACSTPGAITAKQFGSLSERYCDMIREYSTSAQKLISLKSRQLDIKNTQ